MLPPSEGPRGRAIEGSALVSIAPLSKERGEEGRRRKESPSPTPLTTPTAILSKIVHVIFRSSHPPPKTQNPPSGKIYTVKKYFNKIVYCIDPIRESTTCKDHAKSSGTLLALS